MCLNAVSVSMEKGQFTHFTSYARNREQSLDASNVNTFVKKRCNDGLVHLKDKKYKLAAQKFVELGPVLGNNFKEVIALQDVATYGGLCALASFDRTELKRKVIDNIDFWDFLELVPKIRQLIHEFYNSQYASCMERLRLVRAKLLFDTRLRDHVETLCDQIYNKALIQYIRPYVSVDLHKMADAFNTTVAGLEMKVRALIIDNQIQARIDSQNKILYVLRADQRKTTFRNALQTGREFDHDVRAMILRANLLTHEPLPECFLKKSSKH